MSVLFLDTSALGRRYLPETGSAWVSTSIAPAAGNIVVVSDLVSVELPSAFARLQREGTLHPSDATTLENNLLFHLEREYLPVPLDAPVLATARMLVGKYPLRTLDAVQLSCALWAVALLKEPMTFVCADNRLLSAAAGEGFATDNPLIHP